MALISSFCNVTTIYIIRHMAGTVPKPLYPFASGLYATLIMSVYITFYEPLDWGYFPRLCGFQGGATDADW